MDLARFSDLIDRLGDDLSGWPEPDRAAAADLLARSVAARGVLDEALALRRAMASPPVRAPEGLFDRITAAASDLKQPATKPAGDAGRPPKVESADR